MTIENIPSAIDPNQFGIDESNDQEFEDQDFEETYEEDDDSEYEYEDEDEDDSEYEDEEEDEEDYEDESEDEDEEYEYEEEDEDFSFDEDEEDDQQEQTAEQNAYYAEMRRQQQMQERIQAELQQSKEYQIVQRLAAQYGLSPEEMMAQLEEQEVERQAQQQGVPVEVMKRIQEQDRRAQELENKLAQMEFDNWYNERQQETQQIVENYNGIISEEDVQQALNYMLTDLGTTNIPLDSVVRLLHGDKLESELRRIAKQEALAEYSGRKPGPLAPQGGKPANLASSLTAEEADIARKLGMTEEQYSKYKI